MSLRSFFLLFVFVVILALGGAGWLWHTQNAPILVQPVFGLPLVNMAWRLEEPVPLPVLVWISSGIGFSLCLFLFALPSWIRNMSLSSQVAKLKRSQSFASSGLEG